jgi:hypothetical protein
MCPVPSQLLTELLNSGSRPPPENRSRRGNIAFCRGGIALLMTRVAGKSQAQAALVLRIILRVIPRIVLRVILH